MSRARWLVVVAALATLVAGCSDDKSPSATSAPKIEGATSIPNSVPNDPKLRANVQIAACKAAAGGWEATGTAVNPASKDVTLTITVFFTDASATVLATGDTKVVVKANGREQWTVKATFAAPASTLCVLRGVG